MSERVIRGAHFRETFTNSAVPTKDNSKSPHPKLTSGQSKVLVKFDISGIRKQTLQPSSLFFRAKGNWAAQTITITPLDERVTMREVNHNALAGIALRSGEAWTVAIPAASDGDFVELTGLAPFLQTLADGAKNFGLLLSTSSGADNRMYGTESKYKNNTWRVEYAVVEKPDPPTDLSPNGGLVDTPTPVLSSAFRDPGGESKVFDALRVEIGTVSAGSFIPSWDSGVKSTPRPRLNLADTTYPGAVDGVPAKWRMKHRDGAGYWSEWSDVAEFTYDELPTITLINPLAGEVFDCSPTISWSIDSGVMKAWRVEVFRTDLVTRVYDSRKRQGNDATSASHTVPFRDKETRKRILRDDQAYVLRIRVWDRHDREATSGRPIYAEIYRLITVDDDATLTPPASLIAHQVEGTPQVRLTWDIPGGYAEGYVVRRDGERIARLDPDDLVLTGGFGSWIDNGARPYRENQYTVQAVYDGKLTTKSPIATVTPRTEGVWLLSDEHAVVLDGIELQDLTAGDKSATYELLNAPYDLEIIYALRGVSGTYSGSFGQTRGRDWKATYDALMAMRKTPEREVQLVFNTVSVPVWAIISQPMPTGRFMPNTMEHTVTLRVTQSDDFEAA